MLLGAWSIFYMTDGGDDDGGDHAVVAAAIVVRERVCIQWSMGYFVVDLLDCFSRGDIPFSIHAFLSLGISTHSLFSPTCLAVKVIAKDMNRSVGSISQTLYRIRHALMSCIEKTVAAGQTS